MNSVCESESAREYLTSPSSRPAAVPRTLQAVPSQLNCRASPPPANSPKLCAPSCSLARGPSPSVRLAKAANVGLVTQRCLPHAHIRYHERHQTSRVIWASRASNKPVPTEESRCGYILHAVLLKTTLRDVGTLLTSEQARYLVW
ncbi:hypothetical protein OH76DRAFT_554005 [Lentinus brumalis]|uniref:Uncharacterized protein n=1 Tax=Lentinus brumalis TaxID=2498619 RepID=A0A371D975_9APHY|nr:hypothetical protein OH76DRAFT_554005 [Polyporus brumalis]